MVGVVRQFQAEVEGQRYPVLYIYEDQVNGLIERGYCLEGPDSTRVLVREKDVHRVFSLPNLVITSKGPKLGKEKKRDREDDD